jgi:hypothetical protein
MAAFAVLLGDPQITPKTTTAVAKARVSGSKSGWNPHLEGVVSTDAAGGWAIELAVEDSHMIEDSFRNKF